MAGGVGVVGDDDGRGRRRRARLAQLASWLVIAAWGGALYFGAIRGVAFLSDTSCERATAHC